MEDSHTHINPYSYSGSDSSLSGRVGTSLFLVPGRNRRFSEVSLRTHSATGGRETSFRQVNPHHPSCSLLTSLPVWQNHVCDMEYSLLKSPVQHWQQLSSYFPIPESSSRKEKTPCNQQRRSSRSNQHSWVIHSHSQRNLYPSLQYTDFTTYSERD